MRVVFEIVGLCVLVLFIAIGCSNEEDPIVETRKAVVKKRIPARPVNVVEAGVPVENAVEKAPGIAEDNTFEDDNSKPGEEQEGKKHEDEIERRGVYVVETGDSLSSISSNLEIYNDPLKWVHIYCSNVDKLDSLIIDENLPDRKLEQGLRLKVIVQEDFKENLENSAEYLWVINVLSARTKKKIVPNAIKLVKAGYCPYITMVRVKDEDWMRLRIGFFMDKKEALEVGDQIRPLLKLKEIWAVKVEKSEWEDFGRYQTSKEGKNEE